MPDLLLKADDSGNALVLSWPSENISSQTKRATGLGLQISVGNLGAVVGVLLYRPSLNGHLFRTPNIVALGYSGLGSQIPKLQGC